MKEFLKWYWKSGYWTLTLVGLIFMVVFLTGIPSNIEVNSSRNYKSSNSPEVNTRESIINEYLESHQKIHWISKYKTEKHFYDKNAKTWNKHVQECSSKNLDVFMVVKPEKMTAKKHFKEMSKSEEFWKSSFLKLKKMHNKHHREWNEHLKNCDDAKKVVRIW